MMTYDEILDRYCFSPERAAQRGFTGSGGTYTLRETLENSDFYAVIRVSAESVQVDVYESDTDEPYMPFNVKASEGSFVGSIRACVDELLDEVVASCFEPTDIAAALIDRMRRKYGTEPETPWGENDACTLNTARRHKWYALFMLIPYRSLGLDKEGRISVLNLKARPELIPGLIDRIHYFPAYHMNKKHWISVLLDRTADADAIERLLDESYALAEGNK